jgi:hypothetical protein
VGKWRPPPTVGSASGSFATADIAILESWKAVLPASNGFGGCGNDNGLSILFDPLVDALLLWNITKPSTRSSTVLVLTDYYPLLKCNAHPGCDWGEKETERYWLPYTGGHDQTWRLLLQAIWPKLDPRAGIEVANRASERGVYIWNFMPFFRGGCSSSGAKGLPSGSKWHNRCFQWLKSFVDCVGADSIIFAANSSISGRVGSRGKVALTTGPLKGFKIFRTFHPASRGSFKRIAMCDIGSEIWADQK